MRHSVLNLSSQQIEFRTRAVEAKLNVSKPFLDILRLLIDLYQTEFVTPFALSLLLLRHVSVQTIDVRRASGEPTISYFYFFLFFISPLWNPVTILKIFKRPQLPFKKLNLSSFLDRFLFHLYRRDHRKDSNTQQLNTSDNFDLRFRHLSISLSIS